MSPSAGPPAGRRPVQTTLSGLGLVSGLCLVLGGARSGKSRYAESLVLEAARALDRAPLYLATCPAPRDDAEMAARIRAHRARRGDAWTTVEEPLDLPRALAGSDAASPLLLDCLTLWLSNRMLHDPEPQAVRDATTDLLQALARRQGPAVVVSNEVGLGIVPDNALARAFRDLSGEMNRQVAETAGRVVFIAAGLPLVLKDTPSP